MRSTTWAATAANASAVAIPAIAIGVMLAWDKIDETLGSREISQYIRDHQTIVVQRHKHPKVHSFALTHDPSQPGTLLIPFDVDDRATYELLEPDLDDIWSMRFPPQWKTTVRSNERLSRNYGYAAWGIAELGEGMWRMVIAGIASLAPVTCFTLLALRQARRSRSGPRTAPVTTE